MTLGDKVGWSLLGLELFALGVLVGIVVDHKADPPALPSCVMCQDGDFNPDYHRHHDQHARRVHTLLQAEGAKSVYSHSNVAMVTFGEIHFPFEMLLRLNKLFAEINELNSKRTNDVYVMEGPIELPDGAIIRGVPGVEYRISVDSVRTNEDPTTTIYWDWGTAHGNPGWENAFSNNVLGTAPEPR